MSPIAIFWHRRDLRTFDNAGLSHALQSGLSVQPIFIFDTEILDKLEDKDDARVTFIHDKIVELNEAYRKHGGALRVFYDTPERVFEELIAQGNVAAVYANYDYEPYARERDTSIAELLSRHEVSFYSFKDQCIFEKSEVTKDDGKPYTVFTPYMKRWKAKLTDSDLKAFPSAESMSTLHCTEAFSIPTLSEMGFEKSKIAFPADNPADEIIEKYHEQRDLPAVLGTSRLSLHLRFGTVSIRQWARKAKVLNEKWLNELIWRDFYMMILWHFPHVVHGAFKPQYDRIRWENNEAQFEAWCQGRTGYPIVDAGMRELNATGFMHNRVRMIVASFLTKHLLIDWRWGEAYFAQKLLDFEMSSNNGGWQWAASSGCDAAPYFRVFNPHLQTMKFDPKLEYIKRWVPEFQDFSYPKPIVEHSYARQRVLDRYRQALNTV
jgi:deoxyribodipyrimidine photo-lyase